MNWLNEALWQSKIHIGGWVTGSGGDFAAVEPATGKELTRVGAGSLDDVATATARAAEAQHTWAATAYDQREAVLRRAADLWQDKAAEVQEWLVREAGSVRAKAAMETDGAAAECYQAAALAAHPFGEVLRSGQPRLSISRRVPAGVVGVIAPFNFPLMLAIRSVAPALALGNAVVLKPDPRTAVSGGITLARIFEEAAALAQHADALPVGDPYTSEVALGPIIDAGQRDTIHRLVSDSIQAGARLATGGTYEDLFYRPTVLAHTPVTAPAYAEEVFGPVAPVVAYDSLDEAVALATDTQYGLKLGILTRDSLRAMELAERIPVGAVHINDQTVSDEAVAPFGGMGASGTGARFGGPQANLETFTEVQWITAHSVIPAYPY